MSEKETYAPARPFAHAIDEWSKTYEQRHTPPGSRTPGIDELAHRAGISSRTLRAYVTGERPTISLTNADKLAMTLGVSLWTLADEFTTRGEALRRIRAGQTGAPA